MARSEQASFGYFLSISLRNAAWLLCGYWVTAIALELLSKHRPLLMALRVLEHFPEKVLQIVGLWTPLKEAFLGGGLSIMQLRLVYGAAVCLGLVALSLATGLCLWLLQRILRLWASPY
ncbi:MAG: hypothetical protein FWG75_09855 [Cystobacterineae bacterium]|nr:hypothetical protein [Cystobacterineae bacterium]